MDDGLANRLWSLHESFGQLLVRLNLHFNIDSLLLIRVGWVLALFSQVEELLRVLDRVLVVLLLVVNETNLLVALGFHVFVLSLS
jgi:hypothetical protein